MTNSKPRYLTWHVPFFASGTIFFGVTAEDLAARSKQYTAFVKFLSGETEISAAEAESFAPDAENFAFEPKNIVFEHNDTVVETDSSGTEDKGSINGGKSSSRNANRLDWKAKRLGLQPKNLNREIKIFTFGLFVLKVDSRIRAGFVRRHQILIEA